MTFLLTSQVIKCLLPPNKLLHHCLPCIRLRLQRPVCSVLVRLHRPPFVPVIWKLIILIEINFAFLLRLPSLPLCLLSPLAPVLRLTLCHHFVPNRLIFLPIFDIPFLLSDILKTHSPPIRWALVEWPVLEKLFPNNQVEAEVQHGLNFTVLTIVCTLCKQRWNCVITIVMTRSTCRACTC